MGSRQSNKTTFGKLARKAQLWPMTSHEQYKQTQNQWNNLNWTLFEHCNHAQEFCWSSYIAYINVTYDHCFCSLVFLIIQKRLWDWRPRHRRVSRSGSPLVWNAHTHSHRHPHATHISICRDTAAALSRCWKRGLSKPSWGLAEQFSSQVVNQLQGRYWKNFVFENVQCGSVMRLPCMGIAATPMHVSITVWEVYVL